MPNSSDTLAAPLSWRTIPQARSEGLKPPRCVLAKKTSFGWIMTNPVWSDWAIALQPSQAWSHALPLSEFPFPS